jgi:hypothetical protein
MSQKHELQVVNLKIITSKRLRATFGKLSVVFRLTSTVFEIEGVHLYRTQAKTCSFGVIYCDPVVNFSSYKGLNTNGGKTCEHVSFHENIIKQLPNYTFLIQPKFMNVGPKKFKTKVRARLQGRLHQAETMTR